jgi:ribose transport system substrate-binding protein
MNKGGFMKLKKCLVMLMVTMFLLVTLTGLSAAKEEKELWIVFSVKNIVNPFWKACWIGAQKAAAEYKGIKLTYTSPTTSDSIEEQMRIFDDIILKRPDGIVFVPTDYVAMAPTVAKMNKAKIPVFNYCNELTGGRYEIYVGCNDEQLAYENAKNVFKSVGNKGNVIIQHGVPGAITAQDRVKGFKRALAETPGMKLLTIQPADYNRVKAMQVMENLLQRYPKIDVVLAANDEQALGCIEAIDAAGRLKDIKVTGTDANRDAAAAILAGRQFASADYSGHDQGYIVTKAAIEYLRGNKIPQKVMLPVVLVTKENAKAWTVPPEEKPKPNYKNVIKNAKW